MVTPSKEKLPNTIREGANLNEIANGLQNVLDEGEKKASELYNIPFDQPGEENIIDKIIETDSDSKFGDIQGQGINLGILLDDHRRLIFRDSLNKISSDEIKKALIQEIFNKIQNEIGSNEPYNHFSDVCPIPGNTDVSGYFLNIISYLVDKEDKDGGKKVSDIMNKITITNGDLNSRLSKPIGPETPLSTIPTDIKDSFNALLSFEIGKEVQRAVNISENKLDQLTSLFTNSFPAINTIIGEDEEYRYDENKLGEEYQTKSEEVKNKVENELNQLKPYIDSFKNQREELTSRLNSDKVTDLEKISLKETLNKLEQKINKYEDDAKKLKDEIVKLKWEYYLKYLRTKNKTIADALEQLYNNNFDYSKLDSNTLKGYLDVVIKKRLNTFKDCKDLIDKNFGDFDEFAKFYQDLADPSCNTIHLNDTSTFGSDTTSSLDIPITKSFTPLEHPLENIWLKDIDQYGGHPVPHDALPFRYEIKKEDINSLNITDDDKLKLNNFLTRFKDENDKYVIEGGDVGLLICLFFMLKNRTKISEINPEKQENVEALLAKKTNEKNGEQKDKGNESLTPEEFKQKIEKLGPGKFENGSEIWVPIGDSELPGGGYQWMKIKISNINMKKGTFKGTVFGGELKFNSNIEGRSRECEMNQEFFDDLENMLSKTSAGKDKIWLQPNPDKQDFNSFKDSLNGKLGTQDLKFNNGLIRDGDKFMLKNGEKNKEVQYFGAASDDKSTYKIEYNRSKRSFTVSSIFNGEEKGKDGKTTKKRFSYKRNMDWNNFLIFFTQKGLQPQTKEESDNAIQRQNREFKIINGGKRTLHRFSINSIKNGFKEIFSALKKKVDDYNKLQTDEFKGIVEQRLLNHLSKLPLPPSIKYAIGERQQELYNEEYNGAWTEIEKYLKALQSDEQFADTFTEVPPHVQSIYGKSYQKFITDLFNMENDNKISTRDRRKAAALLLANIKKGGSPYRGLTEYQNKGLWVKVLLGNDHYNQFMLDKEKCIKHLENAGKDKDQIQTALANGEMDYIINNVTGANGKLPYFGSHEERGILDTSDKEKKKYKNKYIPNPSKILLSDKFAGELKDAYQGWFTDSSVDQAYEKISHNNFEQAKVDVKRLITSSRDPGAIGNLREMFKLAKTEEQLSECDKYFLFYMLSGLLDTSGTKGLRKQAYQRGTTMSFLPGMLAKNTHHSEQVVELLDDFCQEYGYKRFSEEITSYFHSTDLKQGEMKFDKLFGDLNNWWSVDKMRQFEEYSKIKFRSKDFSNKPALKKLQEDALNPETENINNSMLDNPLIANRGGLFSNTNVVRNRMDLDSRGEFSGKDEDEKNNKKLFWNKVKDDIKKIDKMGGTTDPNQLNLVLTQFFNFFNINSSSDRQDVLKRIATAYYWKERKGQNATHPPQDEHGLYMGEIGDKEIESILWYAFKGNVLYDYFGSKKIPTELDEALNAFQNFFDKAFDKDAFRSSIISKAFNVESGSEIDVLSLGSWDLFDSVIDDNENRQRQKLNDTESQQSRVFLSVNCINSKIAQMERSFRNRSLPEKFYKPVRNYVQTSAKYRL